MYLPIPQVNYTELLLLFGCMSFFVGGARMENRSTWVWGGLSLGAWVVWGGLGSQIAVFFGLTAASFVRDRQVPWRSSSSGRREADARDPEARGT